MLLIVKKIDSMQNLRALDDLINSSARLPIISYCFEKYRNEVDFRSFRGVIFNNTGNFPLVNKLY